MTDKQAAVRQLNELVEQAQAALKKAEDFARENLLEFTFEVDYENLGGYYTYEGRDGKKGYWFGWQGSNC